ncbi:glycosyl transferase [Blastopirellula marina]|uniref:Glycosyl transferase n=1 Tax=Blastopirellula marina TaxID=124 RepID=A0A2S8GNB7_9BACT|nr:glycosyl transferase [Blastopirellula marina]PQO45920.1 glycosyl transferase [Blastopirellula marina]
MEKLTVYTSVTLAYLAKARVLARSVKQHNPDTQFYLVLCEPPPEWLVASMTTGDEPFDYLVTPDDLGIASAWLFQHDVVEACTSVKATALAYLQSLTNSAVIYLDPDTVVFRSLRDISDLLADHSIVLTPHCPNAETDVDAIALNEISCLAHGVYNLGFYAVSADPTGREFANWWKLRLQHFCHDDIPRGLFTDQRWIDLVPAQFERVKILREPQYNVASWNLTQRQLSGGVPNELQVNGKPLCFYHFSGINLNIPEQMARRLRIEVSAVHQLIAWYRERCDEQGEANLSRSRWYYANYDDGTPITRAQRIYYRQNAEIQRKYPTPFATGENSYLEFLRSRGLDEIELEFSGSRESLHLAANRLRALESTWQYRAYLKVRKFSRLLSARR